MNKKFLVFVPIILCYIIFFILFVVMIFQIGSTYQKKETEKILSVQQQVSEAFNKKSSNTELIATLSEITDATSMELIVLNDKNETFFTTFSGINITNIRDVFNGEEVLFKSQGIVNTINGDFDVMLVLYHVSFMEYANQQFIWLTIYIMILFLLLILIATFTIKMLFLPLKNIRVAIREMKDFDISVIDESTIIGTEFKEFVYKFDKTIQNVSKQYTELELLLLFERQRLEFLFKIARGSLHGLKTPVYQALLQNKYFLESDTLDKKVVQYNILQNDKLLKRINDLLEALKKNISSLEENVEYFDGMDLFYETEQEFDVMLEQENIYLSVSSSEYTMIYQNKYAVQLILHNILSNAIKYINNSKEIEFEINVNDKVIEFVCINEASQANIERVTTGRFSIDISNETYSSGNGVFLVKELSKSLGGRTKIEVLNQKVCIIVTIPQHRRG